MGNVWCHFEFIYRSRGLSEKRQRSWRAKKALCEKYGFEGVFPIDVEVDGTGKTLREIGVCISDINENLIKSCQIVIANITPFRGPSADVGTVYEIGFAHALGKKVFAYTNTVTPFTERTVKALGFEVTREVDGKLWDANGMFLEEMNLVDNLMVDGCVLMNSGCLVAEQAPAGELFTYLGGFEMCLRVAKDAFDK